MSYVRNKKFPILLLSFFTLCVAGCSSDKSDPAAAAAAPNPMTVDNSWNPDSVHIACADEASCPDNQGVILAVSTREVPSDIYGYKQIQTTVYRCTGTLYGPTKVITAGHCVDSMSSADKTYFKTVERPGRPSRTIPIKGALSKIFTALDSPDFGVFELSEAVTGVQYAHPAQQVPADVSSMVALVVNSTSESSMTDLRLSAVTCQHRLDFISPILYSSNPAAFRVEDCIIVGGNSGGSVVDPKDLTSVLGIVSGSNNVKEEGKADSSDLSSLLKPSSQESAPKINMAIFSNARCVELPDWPRAESQCVATDADTFQVMSKDLLVKQFASWLENKMQEWAQSSKAIYEDETVALRLVPSPSQYRVPGIIESEEGTVFLPIPDCFDKMPKRKSFSVRLAADAYIDKGLNENGPILEPRAGGVDVILTLKKVDGENYQVSVASADSSGVLLNIQPDTIVDQLNTGSPLKIALCTAGGDQPRLSVDKTAE